jgi:hypothetical protein
MSKRTWQTRTPLPRLHRPIRKALAKRRKSPDSGPLGQRKIDYVILKPGRMISVIAQSMSLFARFKADPLFKSP